MFKVKEKSIKLSKYFEIIRPEYVYLKITPDKSICEQQNTNYLSKAIKATYKSIFKKIKYEKKKLWFEADFKISYVIDIDVDGPSFVFMIPKMYYDMLFDKISSIWQRSTFEILEEGIKPHSKEVKCYKLLYKKEDALSINTNEGNRLLHQLLANTEIMQDNDRVTIIYNFLPCSEFNWEGRYETTLDKIYNNKSVLKNKFNFETLALGGFNIFETIFTEIIKGLNGFLGESKQINNEQILEKIKSKFKLDFYPSDSTRYKRDCGIIDCQMVYLVDGSDEGRQKVNALSVANSFRAVDGDNCLISKPLKTKSFNIENYKFSNVEVNTISTMECNTLVQLPTREQMEQYEVEYIDVTEERVPEKLSNGYLKLGTAAFRGEQQEAYYEDEYNIGNLPIIIVGTQGSGKTTYLSHAYKYATQNNEGGVVLDFIKNNEMTDDIMKLVPQEKIVLLDYTEDRCMQSFAFNELKFKDGMSAFKKRKIISLQAERVLDLVDAVNPNKPLEPRMRRYLSASANVVFATGECSLKEVVNCLQDIEARQSYITKAMETDMCNLLESKVNDLLELTGAKGENRDDRVSGILDRISLLREDFALEYMFDKSANSNIDFVDLLEQGKVIIVKMPQADFSDHARDVITTFFISKIWLATEIRGSFHKQPNRTIVSIDEIFKTPIAKRMLTSKNTIPQTRKFGCKFILTCQSFNQMPDLINSCLDGGSSFMLLKGTKAQDFALLRSRCPEFDYSDITNMENHYSLNIVNYSDGYASFITKLPYEL